MFSEGDGKSICRYWIIEAEGQAGQVENMQYAKIQLAMQFSVSWYRIRLAYTSNLSKASSFWWFRLAECWINGTSDSIHLAALILAGVRKIYTCHRASWRRISMNRIVRVISARKLWKNETKHTLCPSLQEMNAVKGSRHRSSFI